MIATSKHTPPEAVRIRVLYPVSRRMPQAILMVSFCLSYVAIASLSSSLSVKCNRCLCMCLRQQLSRREGRSGLLCFTFTTTGWLVGVLLQTDIHLSDWLRRRALAKQQSTHGTLCAACRVFCVMRYNIGNHTIATTSHPNCCCRCCYYSTSSV